MNSEYPTIEDYLNILDNEMKISNMYHEFRQGKHVYSKKYLYGFDMTDDSRMLWSEISNKTIMNDIACFLDMTMKYYFKHTNTSKEDLQKLLKATNKCCSDNKLRGIYNRYEADIIDDKFMEKLNRERPHHLPISGCQKIDLRDGKLSSLSKSQISTVLIKSICDL